MDARFERVRLLGKGSFGSAVLVNSREDGRQYVVKEVDLRRMPREEREAAHQEAKLLMSLDHPNIVRCHETFISDEGKLCIVMDYCSEGDLAAILAKRRGHPLPEDSLLDLFVQMCLGLKHVHDQRVLHRDIKAQNVFLTSSGIVKLGDFGVSKVLGGTLALAMTAVGTPYYVSPEICLGRNYGFKTDVWSLGCVLYELAAGRPPFEAHTLRSLISKIVKGSYPALPASYSPEFRALVDSLLTLDADSRPSVNEILAMTVVTNRIASFLESTLQERQRSLALLRGQGQAAGAAGALEARSRGPSSGGGSAPKSPGGRLGGRPARLSHGGGHPAKPPLPAHRASGGGAPSAPRGASQAGEGGGSCGGSGGGGSSLAAGPVAEADRGAQPSGDDMLREAEKRQQRAQAVLAQREAAAAAAAAEVERLTILEEVERAAALEADAAVAAAAAAAAASAAGQGPNPLYSQPVFWQPPAQRAPRRSEPGAGCDGGAQHAQREPGVIEVFERQHAKLWRLQMEKQRAQEEWLAQKRQELEARQQLEKEARALREQQREQRRARERAEREAAEAAARALREAQAAERRARVEEAARRRQAASEFRAREREELCAARQRRQLDFQVPRATGRHRADGDAEFDCAGDAGGTASSDVFGFEGGRRRPRWAETRALGTSCALALGRGRGGRAGGGGGGGGGGGAGSSDALEPRAATQHSELLALLQEQEAEWERAQRAQHGAASTARGGQLGASTWVLQVGRASGDGGGGGGGRSDGGGRSGGGGGHSGGGGRSGGGGGPSPAELLRRRAEEEGARRAAELREVQARAWADMRAAAESNRAAAAAARRGGAAATEGARGEGAAAAAAGGGEKCGAAAAPGAAPAAGAEAGRTASGGGGGGGSCTIRCPLEGAELSLLALGPDAPLSQRAEALRGRLEEELGAGLFARLHSRLEGLAASGPDEEAEVTAELLGALVPDRGPGYLELIHRLLALEGGVRAGGSG
ncbi:hypothetical protein Rsub_12995 [Raphidocelis subcapitata]|uniref:non-specific serine/threonine protein kinase n=1 Tax=Raphidocelis subcapitata TaxID=307507 RepID=A0A2V0PPV4_9CHLO|nr:hypothetical protein Rsub_12995 [Raphidocelis subcapitata]|eukprot:GBG00214.1 hypothetical protein Rsub_12995 [Raphidocelis subcapitata]